MLASLSQFFCHNALFFAFAVIALGYPLSRVKIAGASLGIASVLFTGIALGALFITPTLPSATKLELIREMRLVYELGLAIFVYAMGLSIAGSFWKAFNAVGIRKNLTVLIMLLSGAGLVVMLAKLLNLDGRYAAGLFTGSFTNMPALAAVMDTLKRQTSDAVQLAQPTVASAIAYPIGVLIPLLSIPITRRIFKSSPKEASDELSRELTSCTVEIQDKGVGKTHADLKKAQCRVVCNRILRDGQYILAPFDVPFQRGDLMLCIGTPDDLAKASLMLGHESSTPLQYDHRDFDSARVFVSNKTLVGRTLRELQLPEKHACIVTRLRRGDGWIVPDADTELELGDRIRVAAARLDLPKVEKRFGDSYRALSEASFVTFAFGLALGLAVGQIPIPLGHGVVFKLGFAGGPLLVGLILGRVHRMGSILWTLPYSANLTIRQFGLVLFAAGIGVISGEGFRKILSENLTWLPIFVLGALFLTLCIDTLAYFIGHKLFKIPLQIMYGVVAGAHTQPVVLEFASQQTQNEHPHVGFATVYPLATILKIILAQALLLI